MKNYPMVKVEWWDAASYDELYDIDKEFKCSLVVSVGKLLSWTKEKIVLVRDDYTEDDESHRYSSVLVIPKGWVKSVALLLENESNSDFKNMRRNMAKEIR